jgi:hypothetical protein
MSALMISSNMRYVSYTCLHAHSPYATGKVEHGIQLADPFLCIRAQSPHYDLRIHAGATTSSPRGIDRATITAAVMSAVTFVKVRTMSGITSTASRIPTPSAGIPTLVRTGIMMSITPAGIPGMLKLSSTAYTAIDVT